MKPDDKPVEGEIFLDNQRLQAAIETPSGRFTILDKISGLLWAMPAVPGVGSITLERDGETAVLALGVKGERGVLFKTNYYMVRSTEREDYHDISLSGSAPAWPNLTITIRYLMSNSFPVLTCFCYADGEGVEAMRGIDFPYGLIAPDDESRGIFLPRDLKSIQSMDETGGEAFWEPEARDDHVVAGSPFYVSVRQRQDAQSCVIGLLQHPLSMARITREAAGRCVTPFSARLDETGKTEIQPYQVSLQVEPVAGLDAIAWLCKEQMLSPDVNFRL